MNEEFVGKRVKIVWKDGEQTKVARGICLSASESTITIRGEKDNEPLVFAIKDVNIQVLKRKDFGLGM